MNRMYWFMAWQYSYPTRKWYETDEEYMLRVEAYERALDEYVDYEMEED